MKNLPILLLLFSYTAWSDCLRLASAEAPAPVTPGLCRVLTPEAIIEALRQGYATELGLDAASPDNFEIQVIDFPKYPLPYADIKFPTNWEPQMAAPDGTSVIHGRLDVPGQSPPLWAKIRARARRIAIVARHDLKVGTTLRGEDVEKRETWIPFPEPLGREAQVFELFLGGKLRQAKRAGEWFRPADVMFAPAVRLGDKVNLEVISRGVKLYLTAVALHDAHSGDRVKLRDSKSGSVLSAILVEPGKAVAYSDASAGVPRR